MGGTQKRMFRGQDLLQIFGASSLIIIAVGEGDELRCARIHDFFGRRELNWTNY